MCEDFPLITENVECKVKGPSSLQLICSVRVVASRGTVSTRVIDLHLKSKDPIHNTNARPCIEYRTSASKQGSTVVAVVSS